MNDTPRTDVEAMWTSGEDGMITVDKCSPENGCYVPIDFARQLERELKERNQQLTSYKEMCERLAKIVVIEGYRHFDAINAITSYQKLKETK